MKPFKCCKDQTAKYESKPATAKPQDCAKTVNTAHTAVESCLWCYLAIARSLILDSNIGDVVSETSRASSCSSASLTACIALHTLATYIDFAAQNRRKCEQQPRNLKAKQQATAVLFSCVAYKHTLAPACKL